MRQRHRSESLATSDSERLSGWLRQVAGGQMSRREFVIRALALGISFSALGTLLAACGDGDADKTGQPAALDTTLPETLVVHNWEYYMAPKVLKEFEKRHGVQVKESYFKSVSALVKEMKSGASGYDVIFPTDAYVTSLRNAGVLLPLDMSLIPNFANVTQPLFKKPPFDDESDGNKYSVPYMFGTTGFCVRLDKVKSPTESWDMLWDSAYKGDIAMLDEPKEGLGAALFLLGYSSNSTSQQELDEATAKLIEQKPLVVRYDSTKPSDEIISGTSLKHCWDGDAIAAIQTLGLSKARYVLPSEGYIMWADGVCIPKNAPSPYAAHLFLDFLLDPQIAAENANYLGYQPVVEAADPLIADLVQRAMRPTPEVIEGATLGVDLGDFSDQYDAAWEKVKKA
jgi:spermidine/putrescine transport system substrate-binding protein